MALDDNNYGFPQTTSQPGVGNLAGGGSLTPDAFNQLITDASSFSVTLNSGQRNAIQWIATKGRILIGTSGGEWYLQGHTAKPITPGNNDLENQTAWGSKDMQPLVLHEAVLFVDFVGKKLREMVYDGIQERYTSPDVLKLAEHLTRSGGITTMAYQKSPNSIIWATLGNGDLISCTYVREQDVIAWAIHPLPLGAEGDLGTGSFTPPVSTDYPLLRTTTAQDDPGLPHRTAVNNFEDLEAMANNVSDNYYLTGDIDASITSDPSYNSGEGWAPIGNGAALFSGTFDGAGFTISNLFINKDLSTAEYGLFGRVSVPAKIANVTLADCDITGDTEIGSLIGLAWASTTGNILIQNCHSSGTIKSFNTNPTYHGGLIGRARGTASDKTITIYDCSSSCDVTFSAATSQTFAYGGLIGAAAYSIISNCFATGDVTGYTSGNYTGGFVGGLANFAGGSDGTTKVTYCYATGNVTCEDNVGGFVGSTSISAGGYIRKCYSTGNVISSDPTSNTNHGGFAGIAVGEITDCYARGNVTMDTGSPTGGFVGTLGTLTNCYSTGLVTSDGDTFGGFSGSGGTQTSCYWDTETSGQASSGGSETGKTTTLMKTQSTFEGWDFDTIWIMAGTTTWDSSSLSLGSNSVCVIPGETEDEVWITVGRSINGNLVRYIERMKPRNWGPDQEDAFFVDSGLTYDGDATTTLTGLDHLEGETVAILGDGAVFPTQTVNDGEVTLAESVSVAQVGLPFTYKLKPMRMDQAETDNTKGSVKQITEVVVSFFKTLNAKYSDGTRTREFKWDKIETYGTPPALFTGDLKVPSIGGYSVEDPIEITGSDPMPCTIRAMILRIEKTGR